MRHVTAVETFKAAKIEDGNLGVRYTRCSAIVSSWRKWPKCISDSACLKEVYIRYCRNGGRVFEVMVVYLHHMNNHTYRQLAISHYALATLVPLEGLRDRARPGLGWSS